MQKFIFIFLFITSFIYAQKDSTNIDYKYLEDQIYINITYIKLLNLPDPISKTGFSYGVGFGFIKDLPVNKRRNVSFGIGLGYGANIYYFNVREVGTSPIANTSELKSNRFSMHTIEMPIEFRWRTSTAQKYNFLRVYPGFKIAYSFANNSSLKQREDFDVKDILEISKINYGITLSAGYNKWNFHLYYGLNDIFTNKLNNSYDININDLRIGLIFYIL